MQSKVQQLTIKFNCEPRKSAEEEAFKKIAENYYPIFNRLFKEAFTELEKEASNYPKHFRNRNWYAVTMIGHVIGRFINEFGIETTTSNYVVRENHGIYHLVLENDYKLYFKKIDNNFLPHDNNTYNATKRRHQLKDEESDDSVPILYLGYRVDKNWSNLISTHVLFIQNGKDIVWRIDLEKELFNQIPTINPSLLDQNQEKVEYEILVKPKRNTKSGNK